MVVDVKLEEIYQIATQLAEFERLGE